MSAVVGSACCCGPIKTVPCSGSPVSECVPKAIILEGKVTVAYDIENKTTTNTTTECGDCGSGGGGDGPGIGQGPGTIDTNPNDPPIIAGSVARQPRGPGGATSYTYLAEAETHKTNLFFAVSFKVLLVRRGVQRYDTLQSQSDYPNATSLISSLKHEGISFSDSETGDCDSCAAFVFNRTQNMEIQKADQEDSFLRNFSITRDARYYTCEDNESGIDCVMQDYGEGCYETFNAGGFVDIPTDVQYDESLFKSETFFPSCQTFVLDDVYNSGNGFVEQSVPVRSTRWHKIDTPFDACPQTLPRPFTALTGQFPAFLQGCEECTPNPCECWNAARFGFTYGSPNTGGWTYFLSWGIPFMPDQNGNPIGNRFENVAPMHRCQGMGDTEFYVDSERSSEEIDVSCDEEVLQCLIPNTGHPCFGDGCGPPRVISPGAGRAQKSVETKADTVHGFEITRHELLNELPDPAVWPNV